MAGIQLGRLWQLS